MGIIVFTCVEKIIRLFGLGHSHAPGEENVHHNEHKIIKEKSIEMVEIKAKKKKK